MGTEELSKGYTLFQRKGGRQWYMRFSIRGQGQQRLSLGTDDKHIAKRLAEAEWYKTCALADAGLSISKKTFVDIAEDFIASIQQDVERGEKAPYHGVQYPRIIRRYFMEFFGSKQMSAIKAADIQDYWDWRREYWVSGPGSAYPYIRYERYSNGRMRSIKRPVKETYPSDSTMAKELLLLNKLFQYGKRYGYVLEVPQIELVKSKTRKSKSRPGFTLQEFLHLTKVSEERMEEYSPYRNRADTEDDRINQRHFWDRAKLHAFCMVAGFTGMRPTELFCSPSAPMGSFELIA